MRSGSKLLAVLLVGFVLPVVPSEPASAREIGRIDAIFRRFDRPGSPGCAVGLAEQGRVTHAGYYGTADLHEGTPISAKTVFDVASVSKQFTAASVFLPRGRRLPGARG